MIRASWRRLDGEFQVGRRYGAPLVELAKRINHQYPHSKATDLPLPLPLPPHIEIDILAAQVI